MAEKKVKVKVDVETNAAGSIAQLKELKKQLRETAAGSADFKRLANEIDDLEDKIKGAKQGSADWIDTLESAGGPIGAIGSALNKAKVATVSFGTALKATGIGLVVAAVGGLVAAFNNVEGAGKKLEPLMIGLEKILGGIFSALEPLIDAFLDLAMKALPYVTKYIGNFYSGLVSLFTLLKEAGTGVGKILKGIFTLDYDSITQGWDQLTGSWDKAVTEFKAGMERYEEGTKKMTKTEKENLKERQKGYDEAARKRKEAEEKARKEREEANKAADEAELESFKETLGEREREEYEAGLKLAERRAALEKAGRTDTKLIEEAFRKEMADIKAKYDEKEAEEKKKQDEKEAERLKKKAEDERGILLTGLQSQFEALDRKNKQSDLDFEQDLQRLKEQKDILAQQEAIDLQNTELTEFQRTEIRKKYADARMAIVDQEIATEKAATQAKHDINMAYLGLFEQFGSVLQQVAGKNKALAIAGVIIQQAASIGQIIANTGIANAKAMAASPLTFGMPWVAINTVSAGLSIAASIAGAVKSIQQINQAAAQGGVKGGGGSAGAGGAAPSIPAPRVAGAAAPTINTTGGMNPNQQIAETIASARAPMKAYVVSGEVSSQQALDRRTSRAATFTGG
jgi:hypothetical protein